MGTLGGQPHFLPFISISNPGKFFRVDQGSSTRVRLKALELIELSSRSTTSLSADKFVSLTVAQRRGSFKHGLCA